MSNEIFEIEDLAPIEVSEVDEPAVGEYFYFIKRDSMMEDLLSEEFLAQIEKKLGKKSAEAIKNALTILQPIFKDAPEDVKKAIVILAEAVGYGYPEPDKYPEPEEVSKNASSKVETVLELTKKLLEEVEKLKKDILEEIRKRIPETQSVNQEPDIQEPETQKDEQEELLKELRELIRVVEERNKEWDSIISGLEKLQEGE